MSVLSCNRGNCPNIMCDRYSHRYGYICDDCFSQLILTGGDIQDFMDSEVRDLFDKTDFREEIEEELPIT